MASRSKVAGSADSRPRIYLVPNAVGDHQGVCGVWWRVNMNSARLAPSRGEALEAALNSIGGAPAVIFWEGDKP